MQSGQKLRRFDVAAHLEDEETIRAYLKAALDDPTPGVLWLALDNISSARERYCADKEDRD
ncbi:hypothetical protein D3C78_723140 [compost metagenome]